MSSNISTLAKLYQVSSAISVPRNMVFFFRCSTFFLPWFLVFSFECLSMKFCAVFSQRRSLEFMCVCVFSVPVLTAGEHERTGVFVHREIMELQLAFGVDGHSEGEERERDAQKGQRRSVHFSCFPFGWPWCAGFITAFITMRFLCSSIRGAGLEPDGMGSHSIAPLMCETPQNDRSVSSSELDVFFFNFF